MPVIGSNLAVPDKSPNKRKAARWISFLLEDQNLAAYARDVCAVLPAKKRTLEGAGFREGDWPAYAAQLARGVPYPSLASWTAVESEISSSLKLVLLSSLTGRYRAEMAAKILQKAASAVDERLAREAETKTR